MNWSSTPQIVPVHLGRFAEQLRELSLEVRSSVAGLTGDAVGRAVRDVLLRFWQQSPQHASRPTRNPYEWDRDEFDPDAVDAWNRAAERVPSPMSPTSPVSSKSSMSVARLALMLQASGWLLENSPWLLLFAGLGVGGIALFKGQVCLAGLDAINGIIDIASLLALLTAGAKHLGSL
jgi:hypothetical protein